MYPCVDLSWIDYAAQVVPVQLLGSGEAGRWTKLNEPINVWFRTIVGYMLHLILFQVLAFCDVDERKLRQGVYTFYESGLQPKPTVPIVHFSKAEKPFVICVKMDLTGGQFESNLNSLGLEEGRDYVMFS